MGINHRVSSVSHKNYYCSNEGCMVVNKYANYQNAIQPNMVLYSFM